MKLISCNISGFGKIHDRQFDFKDGLNVICEDNGFGKSTLASFIKVMLYGFEDESKKSLKDKEREKFRPWNNGVYGGSIIFEYDGKEYEVFRTFGRNDASDSFEVRELPSNTVSEAFDKKTLGNSIFGIDKDSFFRTAYIASPDLDKSDDNVTDSIRAKLGNLTDATDDINNFDTAVARFEKKLNEYTPERKTGKIKKLENELADKNNRVRSLDDTEKATEILENQILAQTGKLENDRRRIDDLKKTEDKAMKAESLKAKKNMYDSLKGEYDASRKKTDEIFDFFAGHVPSLSDINATRDRIVRMKHLEEEMKENSVVRDSRWISLEDKFANGICSEEEVRKYISLWNETQAKKQDIAARENNLKDEAEEYIIKQKEENREKYEKGLEDFRLREKKRKTGLAIFGILAFLFIGAAVALTVLGIIGMRDSFILIPEVSAFVIGLVFIILIVAMGLLKKGEFNLERDTDISREEAISRIDSSHFARNVIKSGMDDILFANNQVKNFLDKYKVPFREDKVVDDLVALLGDVKEYQEGRKKTEAFEKTKAEYDRNESEVDAFFAKIEKERDVNDSAQLDEYQKRSVGFVESMKESERKKNILVQFETENDITEISGYVEENLPDIDDLKDEIGELEEELEKDTEVLINFRKRLEERQEERDALIALGIQIEEDKETLDQYKKDYDLMVKTLEYLGKAKNALSQKYTGPTMEGFKKYSAYFAEEDTDAFRIDTNLTLTKTEEGMQRRISDLSLGLKEVTDFCLRLALIDAMYQKEKPFVILDDPFVNYDESNLADAMKVLDRISGEYQIIYFTCHESRKLGG